MTAAELGDDELLEAAAANHRVWFDRIARAAGGRTERFGDTELVIAGGGAATIPFPTSSEGLHAAVSEIRVLGLRDVGCWSLAPDAELGTSLVARGFGWGWQPHWMAWDLTAIGSGDPPAHQVVGAEPPYGEDVPYIWEGFEVPDTFHLGVRADGATVGHLVVNPWRGVAGIRLEPFGATLLHLAVEHDQPDFARLAIDRGADLQARDRTWRATAREWAEHFANQPLAEMLDDAAR